MNEMAASGHLFFVAFGEGRLTTVCLKESMMKLIGPRRGPITLAKRFCMWSDPGRVEDLTILQVT